MTESTDTGPGSPAGPPWQAPPAPPVWQPAAPASPPAPPLWQPASPAGATPPGGQPRKRRKLLVAVPVVVAVAVAGGIAVAATRGAMGDTGGAATPEDAVRSAATAVGKQDVGALLSVMNPDEVRTLGPLLEMARQKVAPSGVVQADGVLAPWLSLTLTGITMTDDRPRPDVAMVTLTGGQAAASMDETTMPTVIRSANPRQIRSAGSIASDQTSGGGSPAGMRTIVVLDRGGRWFISPTTTVLEALRRQLRLPAPSFSSPTPLGNGASTPAGAVEGLMTSAQNGDLRSAAGYLSTKDLPGLGWYYNSFAGEITSALEQAPGSLSNLDTSVDQMSDGLQKVTVHAVSGQGRNGSFRYQSGCVVTPDSSHPSCLDGNVSRLTGLTDPFVVTEKDGGHWRVSVMATALEYLRVLVTKGNAEAAYMALGVPQIAPVTATIQSGQSASVTYNQAGYAHIVVQGTPNGCLTVDTKGGYPYYRGTDGCSLSDGGEGVRLGANGKGDLVVVNEARYQTGTSQVTIGQ